MGGVLALICYALIVPIILKVVKQKNEAMGAFAFISSTEIEKIISTSQKVSIRDAKYDPNLAAEFENEDGETLDKKASHDTKKSKHLHSQPPVTQDPMVATNEVAPEGKDANVDQINVEALIKTRRQHKRDHLRSGEYVLLSYL